MTVKGEIHVLFDSAVPGSLNTVSVPGPSSGAQKLLKDLVDELNTAPPVLPMGATIEQVFQLYRKEVEQAFENLFGVPGTNGPTVGHGYTLDRPIWSQDIGTGVWVDLPGVTFALVPAAGSLQGPAAKRKSRSRSLKGTNVQQYLSIHPANYAARLTGSCPECYPRATSDPVSGIALFIDSGRTQILGFKARTDTGVDLGEGKVLPNTNGSIWIGRWKADELAGSEEVCVDLQYGGDPPVVRWHTWLADFSVPGVTAPADVFEDPPEIVEAKGVSILSAWTYSFSEALERRRKVVVETYGSGNPNPTEDDLQRLRAHGFFIELETHFNPASDDVATKSFAHDGELGVHELRSLGTYLLSKIVSRVEHTEYHGLANPLTPEQHHPLEDQALLVQWTDALAEDFESLFSSHFGIGQNSLALDAISEVFEWFAEGSLRVFGHHGVPNGFNYFAFAEFAALVRSTGRNKALWDALFEIFGRTSEIYIGSFHACDMGPGRCWLRPNFNSSRSIGTSTRSASDAVKAQLVSDWKNESHDMLFSKAVHAALRGDWFALAVSRAIPIVEWGCPASGDAPQERSVPASRGSCG